MKELISELKKLCLVKKGKFVLKNGQVSDYYIDMKKAFGEPKAFSLIVSELCKIIDKRVTCIVGSGHGGLPLATAVSIKLGLPLVLVRDKVKKHGLQKMIDGYVPIAKDRVAMVDDVFTMGTSMSKIVQALRKTKAEILAGYVVINRGDTSQFLIPVKSILTIDVTAHNSE